VSISTKPNHYGDKMDRETARLYLPIAAVVISMSRLSQHLILFNAYCYPYKGKGSPYSITVRRDPELIPVLGSQPAGAVSHKAGGRLPLLSARPAVTPATLKRAATIFAAW